jgi:hypothetical protein
MPSCDKYKGNNASPEVKAVKASHLKNNQAFKEKEKMSVSSIWANAHKQVFDNTGKLKREMRKKLGADGERLIRDLELSAGGSAKGDVHFQEGFIKVFQGLNKDSYESLNEIILSRRIIAIENNRVSVARKFLSDNAIGSVFDLTNEQHISLLAKKYGKDRINSKGIKGQKFVTIRKKNSNPDNSDIIMKAHPSLEVATKFADDQVREVLAAADILNPDGLGASGHQAFLDHFKKNEGKHYDDLFERSEAYFAVFKSQLGHMRKAGLIDEDTFLHMRKVGDYSPRRYIQFFDPDITFNNLEQITTGSTQALLMDSALLMRDYVVRLHDRIARNEANTSLYEFAKANPGNGIAEVHDPESEPKDNVRKITSVIDGKNVAVVMPLELGKEWGKTDSALDKETSKLLLLGSGSGIVRTLATGANPGFALTNFPRDVFFSWFRTREFSDAAPIAFGQMTKQFIATFKDVWHTGDTPIGAAKDFLEDGGMMEFMTSQGALEKSISQKKLITIPGLRVAEKVLSFLGQKSELWVRLAIRQQALENGKSRKDATWIARSYLDFSQGGKQVKAIDKGLPYINAGIQATRGMFSTLLLGNEAGAQTHDPVQRRKNIAAAWFKFTQFGMLFSAVMINNIMNHGDAWSKMDDRDKTQSLNLPIGYSEQDANDQTIHGFIKIPLDQGQSGVASLFGLMITKTLRAIYGTDGDTVFHKIAQTRDEIWHEGIANLVPFSSFVPPLFKMVMATQNIDSYMWRNISNKGELNDNSLEQTPFTHPVFILSAKKLNDMFGLVTDSKPFSPERMRVMSNAIFPSSNSLIKLGTGPFASIMDEISAQLGEGDPLLREIRQEVQGSTREAFKNIPGLNRVYEYTHGSSTELQAAAEKAEVETRTQEVRVKVMKNRWLSALNDMEPNKKAEEDTVRAVNKKIKELQEKGLIDRDSMRRHHASVIRAFTFKKKYGKVPNPRLWRDVSFAPSGAPRAAMVFEAMKVANEKHKDEILEQFRRFKFISNDKTTTALARLLRDDARNK